VRAVSAPYFFTIVAGVTTFPQRLDIFRPSGPLTMPWVTRRVTGSSEGDSPSSRITRDQKRK
jgi:hypothetical protein